MTTAHRLVPRDWRDPSVLGVAAVAMVVALLVVFLRSENTRDAGEQTEQIARENRALLHDLTDIAGRLERRAARAGATRQQIKRDVDALGSRLRDLIRALSGQGLDVTERVSAEGASDDSTNVATANSPPPSLGGAGGGGDRGGGGRGGGDHGGGGDDRPAPQPGGGSGGNAESVLGLGFGLPGAPECALVPVLCG